ncbi:Hypothetical protein, putative [Bodo saltans]|uniref:Uncharacterized protein n=1 Tax=Bodo saltans TaxID=75058 RepID=A0A0S4J9S0_BODSA|nr:Hypothetical protein, putative [Bodo saltans]|eukprot:CUG86878.1 Hypothetical protein, putative [Bodo saltans]
MRKSGGGMAAAAALMAANTKPTKRLLDSALSPFDWQFAYYVDRPYRPHVQLLDNPDGPAPTTLILQVSEHCTPKRSLISDTLTGMMSSDTTASPVEEEELEKLHTILAGSQLYRGDKEMWVLFARVLLRRKASHLAHRTVVALPSASITPELWREIMESVTQGRMNNVDLINRLLDEEQFPLRIQDVGKKKTTPRFPAVSHSILKRYIATVKLVGGALHPAPFLAFFKCVQDVRDPHAKTPMVHWKLVLRHFQQLNKSCPTWYVSHPAEAADLVKYVILACSSGADPNLTLQLARVAASRHILDGVELSLWLMHRMVLSHHVEETKEVAHRLVQWLFHTVGIHLLPRFHSQLIPLARNLLNIEAVQEVGFIYSTIIDHVAVFSEEFRIQWMETMRDILCSCCGSVFGDLNVHNDRVCATCMHVTPAKSLAEVPSYVLTAEHLERLRKRRKVAKREGQQRLRNLVSNHENSSRAPMTSEAVFKIHVLAQSSSPKKDSSDAIEVVDVSTSSSPVAALQIGDNSNLQSLVLDKDASETDVRAAVEEASRRKDLLEGVRQRFKQVSTTSTGVTVPSTIPQLQHHVQQQFRAARERAVLAQIVKIDGAWQCVWCQEQNTPSDSRITCSACAAETGPEASWRTFLSQGTSDIQNEIRSRIRGGDAADAVIAAYNLMVYRKSFLMQASEIDFVLLEDLVRHLIGLHERVLAGYLFMRMIPASRRANCVGLMKELSVLFGNEPKFVKAIQQIETFNVSVDIVVFDAIFNAEQTCKVCFGQHRWEQCPIVTRDFTTTRVSINLSVEEKKRSAYQHLKQAIAAAVAATIGATAEAKKSKPSLSATASYSHHDISLVHAAYQAFLSSNREPFSIENPVDTNNLSRALSFVGEFVRGSFVLLHIPVHMRLNSTYADAVGYFGVSSDDFSALMQKRSAIGIDNGSHPNFVQVTRTCCICLEKQHASFQCPKMTTWADEVKQLMHAGTGSGSDIVVAGAERIKRVARLRAQVDGWVYSGPERLEAFQRFLIEHLEELITTKTEETNPAFHAFNKTVLCLQERGRQSNALRLYSRLPSGFVSRGTTMAMLVAAGYQSEIIPKLMQQGSYGGRDLVFQPNDRCLCCFESGHSFLECPDIVGFASGIRIMRVMSTVGSIRSSNCGILAAADYVYHQYNFSHLSSEMLRAKPDMVQKVLWLMHRCFASGLVSRGVRLLRRVPVEMLEIHHYETMWRATSMPEDLVAERVQNLQTMFHDQNLTPSSTSPQRRITFPREFITGIAALIHGDHCRHCYEYGHHLSGCTLFHEEAEFGRDFIAVYRVATMLVNLYERERLGIYATLVRFVLEHQLFLPYHILGVHNGMNALSASLSMDHEPGLGFRVLQVLPPAYRKRHAMHYALNALGVTKLDCMNVLREFHVTGDAPPPLLLHRGDEHATGTAPPPMAMEPQHLIVMRPPIPDLMFDQVIGAAEGGKVAVANAEARLEQLVTQGMAPRGFVSDAAEREEMQLPIDFSQTLKELTQTTVKGTLTTSAGAVASSMVPSQPSDDPTPGARVAGPRSYKIKQVCDIAGLREAFSPIMDFMEQVSGAKLGSRSPLLQVTEILQELVSSTNNSPPNTPPASSQRVVAEAVITAKAKSSNTAAAASPVQQATTAPPRRSEDNTSTAQPQLSPQVASAKKEAVSTARQAPSQARHSDTVESVVHVPSHRNQQHQRGSKFGHQKHQNQQGQQQRNFGGSGATNSQNRHRGNDDQRNSIRVTPRGNHQHDSNRRGHYEEGQQHRRPQQQQQQHDHGSNSQQRKSPSSWTQSPRHHQGNSGNGRDHSSPSNQQQRNGNSQGYQRPRSN